MNALYLFFLLVAGALVWAALTDAGRSLLTGVGLVSNQLSRKLPRVAQDDDPDALEALLAQGHDVNERDAFRNTALHVATAYGHERVVKALLRHGADLERKNNLDFTPLHCAAIYGQPSIARLLLEAGATPNSPTGPSINPTKRTPLHFAAMYGEAAVVALLLEHGAAVDEKDSIDKTPLRLATDHALHKIEWQSRGVKGTYDLSRRFSDENAHLECARLLLAAGANVNHTNKDGSPLHTLEGGAARVAQLLLEHDVDVAIRDQYNRTALENHAHFGSGLFATSSALPTELRPHREGRIRAAAGI